jgi:uncharacterized phage infection (PIP) family protein YhgE
MNAKSNQIETELNQVTNRLDELTEMRERANNNLQNLQQGFIDGKTPLDAVQVEQGKLTTLDASIKTLEAKQDDLHAEFQKACNVEAVQTGIGRLKAIAEQADAAFDEWNGLRVKLDEITGKFVDDIFSKSAEFYGKQKEFRALRNQLESRDSGIDIGSELKRLELSEKARESAATENVNLSPCKFGQSIVIAERIVGQERQWKQHAIEKEEFKARRAETQAAQQAKRQKERANQARQLEADRAQIVQFRIDNKLPAYSANELETAVGNLQMRKADARLRGATVN